VPDQTVPAGPVYVAWANFPGSGNNPHTKLMFARSTDCGATWSQPTKLDESYSISQSPVIAVNPANGSILVAWRQFGHAQPERPGTHPGRDLHRLREDVHRRKGGCQPRPQQCVCCLRSADVAHALEPAYRMFRTNGYPTACTGSSGVHHVAWAQRGIGPGGDARIVVTASTDGITWSTPQPVDNHGHRGHQFMPRSRAPGRALPSPGWISATTARR